MKHRIGYNRLGRKSSHRKALIKNMVTQLYRHERIRTTKSKALEVRRKAEKLITRAKEDSLHNRRTVGKIIQDKEILAKLFNDIGPRFAERAGGYTRILKIGYRNGDAAEMVLLELVEGNGERKEKPSRAKKSAVAEEKKTVEEEAGTETDEPEPAAEEGAVDENTDGEEASEEGDEAVAPKAEEGSGSE